MPAALARLRALAQHPHCAGVIIDVDLRTSLAHYTVSLLDADGTQGRPLVSTPDETGARRAWRLLARVLRVARLVATPEGGHRVISTTMGELVVRPQQARRPRRVALRRRPLARKRLSAPIRSVRYADEREMIARS